jgi:hypothetical protein
MEAFLSVIAPNPQGPTPFFGQDFGGPAITILHGRGEQNDAAGQHSTAGDHSDQRSFEMPDREVTMSKASSSSGLPSTDAFIGFGMEYSLAKSCSKKARISLGGGDVPANYLSSQTSVKSWPM